MRGFRTPFRFTRRPLATGELSANQARQDWLEEIAQLIDAGRVKVFVSQVFSLEQAADAHRESATWHVRGKLVLALNKDDAPA